MEGFSDSFQTGDQGSDSRNWFARLLPCLQGKMTIMNVKMEGSHSQRNLMKFSKREHEVLHQGRKLSQVGA